MADEIFRMRFFYLYEAVFAEWQHGERSKPNGNNAAYSQIVLSPDSRPGYAPMSGRQTRWFNGAERGEAIAIASPQKHVYKLPVNCLRYKVFMLVT